ncbi:MAG: hypothetical protein AB7V32_11465 [Candidatus Berkiella sp.]
MWNWIKEKATDAKDFVMGHKTAAAINAGTTAVVMASSIASDTARFSQNPVGVLAERLSATALTSAAIAGVQVVGTYAFNKFQAYRASNTGSIGEGHNIAADAAEEEVEQPKARSRSRTRKAPATETQNLRRSTRLRK